MRSKRVCAATTGSTLRNADPSRRSCLNRKIATKVASGCFEEYLRMVPEPSPTVGEFMSAPASSSKRDPTPTASSGPKENEAGQASKLAHLESLLSAERRTLELISGGAGLTEILQDLCDTIDAQAGNTISAVMLMDTDGMRLWHGAGPRLPKGWIEAITPLKIGPSVGSCGTAAALKRRVIVSDIATDPLWVDYRDLALSYGLRAAWSQPLLTQNLQVLGTFGMYYAEPRTPSQTDLQLIEGVGNIAVIAIEGERSHTALQQAYQEIKQSEARLRRIIDTIPTLAWCSLPDGTGEFWNRRWHDYTGLSSEAVHGRGWQDAIHPEDLKEVTDKWLGFLASGQPGEVEGRLRRFDGVYRWFLFRVEPLRDELGNIVNWYGTDTDIDGRKRAER